MTDLLAHAYDPDRFRRQGHQLIDLLAGYFEKMLHPDADEKVLNYASPEALFQRWKEDLENAPHPQENTFFATMLHDIIHMHHPKYMGHQTSNVAPLAALAELTGAVLDPGMGVYEQGTSGVAIERVLSKKIGGLIGWDDRCDGFLTSGGTLGNLTALLCARQVMAGDDVWENGLQGKQYAFMVSEQAHYSVARAVKVMGMGERGIIRVPVDQYYRMRTDLLDLHFEKAKKEGVEVLGVVASSCATATGSYDPIDAIADFCEAKKIWLHVDGAHGACVLFSKKYRHLLSGIDRADSVIMDFHKMLLSPKLITSVLFKNAEHSYQTFAQKASYLWDKDEGREWFNLGKRTFELTKSFMSIRVYALWRRYGEAIFEQNVDRLYGLAKRFSKMIAAQPDFEAILENPESNIVCFRYLQVGWPEEKMEKINLLVRERIVREGRFFIVQTRVDGRLYLRVSLMNPFTTEKELTGLLEEIRSVCAVV
ncbi:MAG TPA: aspartate aminotransferase family protein [Bacteroidetes bacterium]|nr:aspartate aminotransferase family protein [Bacteroidota bacterium]